MADLYAKPSDFIETGYNPEQQQAGGVNKEVEEYLNSLPLEERDAARQRLMAPPTGEEIAMMVDQDETYLPTIEQFDEIEKWHKTKEVGIFDGLGTAAEMVFNEFGAAFGSATDKPLETAQKLPATVIEAFMQGTRAMYGMAAQSQNPDSAFFRVKDFLNGTGTREDRYNQYLEALDFNRKSKRLMEGKETLVMDKDLINPEVTQAMSYIADPSLFIPFGKVASAGARAVGMGEKLTLAAGRATAIKNKIIGGAIKWGAGQPLEFLGGAVRNTIDFGLEKAGDVFETATGMEAKEFARTARLSGIGVSAAGVAGHSIPYANAISDAYFTAGAGRGLGEALTAVGETMGKSPFERGINSWAREALEQANKSGTPLSKQAQGLLKALDAVDPMFAYSYAMAEGAAQGMAIGGTLGYLSGGEEGLYQGMGAGLALGTMGAGAGKVVADVTGGTGVARRAVQAKMVIEGKKVTDPETAVALQALQSAAESRGKDVDFVNGIIAGIDNLAPNTVLHALTVDQFKIEAVKQGYDPDTGRFAETQNLVDLSEFGDNRQMRGRTTAFLRLLGGSFAGDADKLLRLSKDARFQTKLNERIKTQFNTLSEFEKDFVVRELKRQKALIDSGKKKASDFRADYEAVSWGESWTAEIIKKYGTDAEGAKRDIKSILDDETVNGKLTRRGRVLKDRLRAEGFLSRNGDILSERNLHDADMTSGVFDKIKGAVVTREADGKTHLYLNLESFGDETFPHELFHAIFRDSPMKHQFVDSLAGKLLGVRDEKGNLIKEPEIAPSELKRFFKRYIEKTTYNQDGSFNREAADRMYKLVENGLAEYEATGDLKKISDSTRQLLNKYTEEFGAYYFSNWIMGKNRNYLFYGGELRGIAGIIDSVKENWLDFWQSKISSANPSFDFSKGVNEAFAKGGSVGRISAIDIWMRDMVRANANSMRGAFNPDTMSADNARQFYRSNGIRNIADSNGRPLQVNKQTAESRRLGREAFKILNGLDPTLRTTRTTLDTDGKQVITGKFSDAELDALVRGGIVPRAWADKVRQGYAMVDGTMPNVASFGYLGKTEQIGDYSWPRKTGKDVAFKNRKAIVFDVETKVRADGTFYTLFHTLDKAVIEQRGNDLWRNAEVRKLWNDDRGAMEADFFNYLNNASKPSTDSTKKDSASLLEKGDGLGAKRRDAMHQMAGMALQEGDSYRHKPMAEIPQGIRHSVTTFNVDGMTTLRIDKTERYNVDMNNAHKFIRENWQPEDMKQEKTPNGMAFTHASGFKFLRTDDGKVSVYTVVGNKVGTYNNLKEATQKAKSEYHKVYDNIEKSVRDIIEKQNKDTISYQGLSADERAEAIESGDVFSVQSVKDFVGNRPLLRQTRDEHIYQRAFEAIKNPEELFAYAESVTRENLKVKAEFEKLVKERERRSQILEEQKNAFADTHYAKLEELKKKHNYVTSWEQWKGALREAGEWRPPSDSVNDYSKYLIEKQAQYEENAKKSWANLAADPEYIALMSNMDRWQESFVKPQVDLIINLEEQIERFKVENQEALSDPVAVELYGNVMKYETLSRTDKADMFARIVGNSARNRDYSGLLEALFAREYDDKIQTGKPFVAVTTHGTKSVELMVGRVYSEEALGSKHNIPSSNMGTFSAGSQNTSSFYAEFPRSSKKESFKTRLARVLAWENLTETSSLVSEYDSIATKHLGEQYEKARPRYEELSKKDFKINKSEENAVFREWTDLVKQGVGGSKEDFIRIQLDNFQTEGGVVSKYISSEMQDKFNKILNMYDELFPATPDKKMQVRSLIRMDNPYVVIDPRSYEEYRISPHMRRAIENGHDGIVFKRFEDGGQADNVYVIFKGFADEQTKIIDTSWDDVGVPRGRDETGRVLKSGKELNLSFQPDEDRVFDFEPNSKKAAKLVNDYLYGLRTGKSHQDMITPELSYVLDNLEKFTKASNDDVVEAILKLGDRGGSVVNRLQNNEISLKQAVEEAKNIDEYTYLYELKNIRDERKGLYNAFMRATGQMRKISDKDGRRFNTHAEREHRNTSYEPTEDYQGGDDYWKPKKNRFESKDEQGFLIRALSVYDEKQNKYLDNPESLDWMDIGHTSDDKVSGMWYVDDVTRKVEHANVSEYPTHEDLFSDIGEENSLKGRIDFPVYKQGKLVKRGRISIAEPVDGFAPDLKGLNELKSKVVKSYNLKSGDVDAYYFGNDETLKNAFGLSSRDQLPIKFQPDEGGRTYSEQEMAGKFIGRYAAENPNIIKGKSIMFTKDQEAGLNGGQTYRLSIGNKNEKSGYINVEVDESGKSASVEYTQVDILKQGRGYGNLLYSEMVERLRYLGVKEFSGWITNQDGIPQKIRKRIIDKENARIGGEKTKFYAERGGGRDAISKLEQRAWYEPDEGGRTYSEKEMAGKFIGRYAAENKGIDNGLKLFYGKVPAGMGALGLTLRDKKGEVVAHGQWQRIGDYVMDLDVKVDPKHQGKGYGNLLYSEAVERMRADGVEIVQGFVIDEKQRPVKIRQRIIDKENARLGSKKRTEMVEQIDDEGGIWESGLDKKAWYEPDEDVARKAKNAGYTLKGYHITNADFNVFDLKAKKVNRGNNPAGFYFSTEENSGYQGKRRINAYIKLEKPWDGTFTKSDKEAFKSWFRERFAAQYEGASDTHIAYLDGKMNDMIKRGYFPSLMNGDDATAFLLSRGYDGWKDGSDIAVFKPENIKSAEDFTYDDKGEQIPLSQRFDTTNKDIRFQSEELELINITRTQDVPWFRNLISDPSSYVRYVDVEELNSLRGLYAVSHGADTLTGVDVMTDKGRRVVEGKGGLGYALNPSNEAGWASIGSAFVKLINDTVKLNLEDKDIGQKTAILPLVFTTYRKNLNSVQGSEAFYNFFEILRRGKIVSDTDLRLAMADAVVKTYKDKKGNIKQSQTDTLKMLVSDTRMNWDEMLSGILLTLDKSSIQNFGTRGRMVDDFFGAVWNRLNLSEAKQKKIKSVFPEWTTVSSGRNITVEDIKTNVANITTDTLSRNLKNGDVYAILKFNDFVTTTESNHRSYDTGVVQENGKKPEVFILKKPISINDFYHSSVTSKGERVLSDISDRKVVTNLLGMNARPYGQAKVKPKEIADFRSLSTKFQPAEWSDFKTEQSPMGRIIKNAKGYSIMLINNKYRVYNPAKAIIGVYGNEEEAKRRVLRDAPKQ